MTTWGELRTVALVGTERRALPMPKDGSPLAALPADLSAELAALHAASLLGVARRAGGPIRHTAAPSSPPSRPSSSPSSNAIAEPFAPTEATQLLELMLTGNTGPGTMSDALLEQWYACCVARGLVVPHRLLVPVLENATTTSKLRDAARGVIGERGRWLAGQRDKWNWAAAPLATDAAGELADDAPRAIDFDELLQLPSDQRDATLVAARAADPATGRRLIADVPSWENEHGPMLVLKRTFDRDTFVQN